MRPSKGVFDVPLSLVCQPTCRLFGKGQMSLSLFRYNTNVAVVLNLCDAVSNTSCYNPSNRFARARLAKTRHVTEYSPAKTGEYPRLLKTVSFDDAIREF